MILNSKEEKFQTKTYIYVWKLNQTVLELDFLTVIFLFFPRRDLIYVYKHFTWFFPHIT